jgi:hypothetical protein
MFSLPLSPILPCGVLSFNEEGGSVGWYGTAHGLIKKNSKDGTTRKFVHDPGDPNSMAIM